MFKNMLLSASLLSSGMFSQTASVEALRSEDTKVIKALYEEKERVETEIKKFNEMVELKYIPRRKECEPYSLCGDITWRRGFIYTQDFKYIVPKQEDGLAPSFTPIWTGHSNSSVEVSH